MMVLCSRVDVSASTVSAAEILPSNPDFPLAFSRELHIRGNKIYNDMGDEVYLRGVNLPSMEYSGGDANLELKVDELLNNWNINIIRLPLNQQRWLSDNATYKNRVRGIVDKISAAGKYVEFDLHWSGGGTPNTSTGQRQMPDMYAVDFWKSIAEAYKNHPAVLFNLYNEPNPSSWDIWRDGGVVSGGFEAPGHQRLVDEIRSVGANNIIVASGIQMASTLSGIARNDAQGVPYALRDSDAGNGIMYEAHLYPGNDIWFQNGRIYNNDRSSAGNNPILCISELYPIIIGEFGQHYNDNLGNTGRGFVAYPEYMDDFLNWADTHELHWTAWAFHKDVGPPMLTDNEPDFTPNAHFGQKIKDKLLSLPQAVTYIPQAPPPAPKRSKARPSTYTARLFPQ